MSVYTIYVISAIVGVIEMAVAWLRLRRIRNGKGT